MSIHSSLGQGLNLWILSTPLCRDFLSTLPGENSSFYEVIALATSASKLVSALQMPLYLSHHNNTCPFQMTNFYFQMINLSFSMFIPKSIDKKIPQKYISSVCIQLRNGTTAITEWPSI